MSYTWNDTISSVTQLCLTLFDPMDYSIPGFSVLHHLPEFTQTHVYQVGDAIQPFHLLSSPSPPAFNFSGSFLMSQFFTSGGQSIGASASASLPPMNIQDWFPLGLTGLISLQSKGNYTVCSLCFLHFSQAVSSVTPLCPTFCDPMDCSSPSIPVHHQLLDLLKFMSVE